MYSAVCSISTFPSRTNSSSARSASCSSSWAWISTGGRLCSGTALQPRDLTSLMANSNSSWSDSPSGNSACGKSRTSSSTASPEARSGSCDRWIRPSRTHCSRIANGLSIPEPVRDRHPAISAECSRRNLDSGSGLAALVFIGIYHANYAPYELFIKSHFEHLGKASIFFDVCFENWIQDFIRRQKVRIELIGSQLRRRWLGDNFARDPIASARPVTILGQPIYGRLHYIF